MTENQIGILIAVILLTVMFTPMIIYSLHEKIKEIKYKNAFKSYPKQEKTENKTFEENKPKEIQPEIENIASKKLNHKPFIESDDDNWEEFYHNTIKPYYKKPYKPTQQYQQKGETLPYQLKPSVMTNHEKIMYNLLSEYCKANKLVLLSKVRIADFIEPVHKGYTREFYQWINKINCKHIDFLICDTVTLRPMIAIELDDNTHKYKNRMDRDDFVDNVYNSVNLPIIHFWDVNEISIRVQLNNILGIPNETKF